MKLSAEYLPATNIVTSFRASVMANDNAYDAVFPQAYYASGAITDELCLDLYQLPYVDFSDPWWDQGSVETLSTGDKLFMVNSDFTLSDKNSTGCIIFNKKLQEENGIEDLYRLVNEGKWTLDKLTSLSENVSADLDGNGTFDEEDRYGIVASAGFSYQLLHGANCWYVSKDNDGMPRLSFNNERTIGVAQRIMSIFGNTEVLYNTHNSPLRMRQGSICSSKIRDCSRTRISEPFSLCATWKQISEYFRYRNMMRSRNAIIVSLQYTAAGL